MQSALQSLYVVFFFLPSYRWHVIWKEVTSGVKMQKSQRVHAWTWLPCIKRQQNHKIWPQKGQPTPLYYFSIYYMTAALNSNSVFQALKVSTSTCLALAGFGHSCLQESKNEKPLGGERNVAFRLLSFLAVTHNFSYQSVLAHKSTSLVWRNAGLISFPYKNDFKHLTSVPLPLLLLLMLIILTCVCCCYTPPAGCSPEKLSCKVSCSSGERRGDPQTHSLLDRAADAHAVIALCAITAVILCLHLENCVVRQAVELRDMWLDELEKGVRDFFFFFLQAFARNTHPAALSLTCIDAWQPLSVLFMWDVCHSCSRSSRLCVLPQRAVLLDGPSSRY